MRRSRRALLLAFLSALCYSTMAPGLHLSRDHAHWAGFNLWFTLATLGAHAAMLRWMPYRGPISGRSWLRPQPWVTLRGGRLAPCRRNLLDVLAAPMLWMVLGQAQFGLTLASAQQVDTSVTAAIFASYAACGVLAFWWLRIRLPAEMLPRDAHNLPVVALAMVCVAAALVVVSQAQRPWQLISEPALPRLTLGVLLAMLAAAVTGCGVAANVIHGLACGGRGAAGVRVMQRSNIDAKVWGLPACLLAAGATGALFDPRPAEIAAGVVLGCVCSAGFVLLRRALSYGESKTLAVCAGEVPLGVAWLLMLGVNLPQVWVYLAGVMLMTWAMLRLRRGAPPRATATP